MEFKSFNHFSCSVLNSNVFLSQIRTRNLMEFASFSGLNVLLVGANGSGKTKLIEEFIDYMERLGMSDRVWWMNMFNCLSSILVVEAQFWKKHVYLIMTGMLTFIKKKSASKFDILGQELLWEWQNSTRAQVAYSFDFFFSDPQAAVWKRLVFSGASTAKQLQSFLESNIYHRQGKSYLEYAAM